MKIRYLLLAFTTWMLVSCKKLIEVPAPVITIDQESAYSNDASATAVLNSVYAQLSSSELVSGRSTNSFMTAYLAASADEVTHYLPGNGSPLSFFYKNAVNASTAFSLFDSSYSRIYLINNGIDNLLKADKLTSAVRNKLLGEAYFLRAYFYFNLVNVYGDLPLVLSTDYELNSIIGKTTEAEVYKQITSDLLKAKTLLSKEYLKTDGVNKSPERTVPNYYAAAALLARVYLYQKDYAGAEKEATEVIEQSSLYSLSSLTGAFLKNSTEALFQLQPVIAGWNTEDAKFFTIPASGFDAAHPVYLSSYLLNAFETDDQRRVQWVAKYTKTSVTPNVDYYYAYKYRASTLNAPVTEYSTVLRLAEQFLIRAEARAMQDKISDAQDDLNKIRKRAGLQNTTANSKGTLMTAILHERQVELFTESGHRWLDLKRLALLDTTMGAPGNVAAAKGGSWGNFRQLFPFSQDALKANPKLTQNQGY